MVKIFPFLCAMFIASFVSCNGVAKPNPTANAVEKTDSCRLDSKNSYEIFVPRIKNPGAKLPLLIILDSHGSAKFALNKFKQCSNQWGAVLVASNLIKNGFPDFVKAIQSLVEDVREKYPVEQTLFLTGFSGGARMALGYALAHPVNGLILCGALGDSRSLSSLSCPIVSISGMDDFNFIETAQYLFQEQSMPHNLKIELTNASHSWPDSQMLEGAYGLLCLSSRQVDKAMDDAFSRQQQARIDSFEKQGDCLKATLVAGNMATMDNLDTHKTFTTLHNRLKASPGYTGQLNKLGQSLQKEVSARQTYMDAFSSKDETWWKTEVETVDRKIKTASDGFSRDMYLRIKGFWGISCYSYCRQAVVQHDAQTLGRILPIYKMVEPLNSDMLYFSSFPPFWKGDHATTVACLKQAIQAGYSDKDQLKRDFSEDISANLYR